MRCKICGAELKKTGDICNKCYSEYVKEEEIKKQVESNENVLLRLHRKYLPKYQLTRYIDYYALFIIILLVYIVQKQYLWFLFTFIFAIVFFIIVLAYNKYKAINTTCTFYEDRIIWKYKDKVKSLEYSNLENIIPYQLNHWQRKYNLADIQFRPVKGSVFFTGFEIKNVPDFKENWVKICEIVNSKRES